MHHGLRHGLHAGQYTGQALVLGCLEDHVLGGTPEVTVYDQDTLTALCHGNGQVAGQGTLALSLHG